MGWLARLCISKEDAARHRLYDPYAWHKFAWQCFPGTPEAPRDFLTRLDAGRGGFTLYLLGKREPHMPAWCQEAQWAVKPVAERFLHHAQYRFDVLVNPTRKVKVETANGGCTKNGKRVALTRPEDQHAWFVRKANDNGFCLDANTCKVHPPQNYAFSKKAQRGLHVGVRVTGHLRVTDRHAFETAFYTGIGSAKAFGFGLMLLQPLA